MYIEGSTFKRLLNYIKCVPGRYVKKFHTESKMSVLF